MRVVFFVGLALAAAAGGRGFAQPAPAAPAPNVAVTSVGATLNITPKRVTFDRNHRNAAVFILNQGDAPATVDITLVDRVMLPDGQIVAVDEAAKTPPGKAISEKLRSAHEIVQISPRRVTLVPGKGQTIRLRLSAMPEGSGELRTHMTVTTIPPRDTGTTAEAAAAGAGNELRFQITAVYGISIPVIVRSADPDPRAGLENAHVEFVDISPDGRAPAKRTPMLTVDLVRAGASSLYGNVEVRGSGDRKGSEPLGVARGVGLYPEIDRRVVRIPLTRAPAAGERLEVTFTDDDTSPGKVLAKAAP